VPMFNVENACATASTAFMGAWKDVSAGTHELSVAVSSAWKKPLQPS
jgi:acetyl-CoA acetyltransferase